MAKRRHREYLTQPEIDKLLCAAEAGMGTRNPQRDYCMLLMIYRHGLRVSELCCLQLSDIDFGAKTLRIRDLQGSNYRVHNLGADVVSALRAWLAKRAQMALPRALRELFISERRKCWDRGTVFRTVKLIGCAAGLGSEIHPHMLRHSTGYALVEKNNLELVQDYLGLRSISSAARYTKRSPGAIKARW